MNITPTPQLEHHVKQKFSAVMYHSASEVVREALRLFEEHTTQARQGQALQ